MKSVAVQKGLDLLDLQVDVIVLDANNLLQRQPGSSDRVFAASGSARLKDECDRIGFTDVGRACLTGGHGLKSRFIIHTLSPDRRTADAFKKLESCYAESIAIAIKNGCETIAFPLLGVENHGWDPEESLQIAKEVFEKLSASEKFHIIVAISEK